VYDFSLAKLVIKKPTQNKGKKKQKLWSAFNPDKQGLSAASLYGWILQ